MKSFIYHGRIVTATSKKLAITKIISGVLSKDAYERKAYFADKVALSGIRKIAEALEVEGKGTLDELEEKLRPLSSLSHARHEMHSSKDSDMDCMDRIGHQYSEDGLGREVQQLNNYFGLVPGLSCDVGKIPEVSLDDPPDIIADYFGIDESELENNMNLYYEKITNEWRECKDDVSSKIRRWFKALNDKYGTNFPE